MNLGEVLFKEVILGSFSGGFWMSFCLYNQLGSICTMSLSGEFSQLGLVKSSRSALVLDLRVGGVTAMLFEESILKRR